MEREPTSPIGPPPYTSFEDLYPPSHPRQIHPSPPRVHPQAYPYSAAVSQPSQFSYVPQSHRRASTPPPPALLRLPRRRSTPPPPPPPHSPSYSYSSESTLVADPYSSTITEPVIPCANIIVFGESGAGKSSVINMVAGRDVASTSSNATGCTFRTEKYSISTPHLTLNLFDTAGLNEGSEGTVQSADAIKNLYKLVRSMEDGVNLLVYVVKGPRIKESTSNNYRMFYEAFCQKKVPIVLVITGLENESNPDEWWRKNYVTFRKYKMEFAGQACITATRGKLNEYGRHMFQREYDESKPKVKDLITQRCAAEPFKMEKIGWFLAVLKTTFNGVTLVIPGVKPAVLAKALYLALCQAGGLPPDKAKKLANEIERQLVFTPEALQAVQNDFDKAFLVDGIGEESPERRRGLFGLRWPIVGGS
ncbi:hypothetical protein JAAARDRAFT_175394 [Jaapia argillacea MUCL 33604]|uniref:AIG1-type G domain-containing protein n=1 Tax=Jaapia argillacea MUCL 33604 TaxID=933084 RepID=A0A067QB77_9AGAM|nr:hypothetical protein JAAARDRAFT_175394 [Jaapia argillacea MUCL 33604]